jgi:hypothetical protein
LGCIFALALDVYLGGVLGVLYASTSLSSASITDIFKGWSNESLDIVESLTCEKFNLV